MVKPIIGALREVKTVVKTTAFLHSIMDSILVFLLAFLVLILIKLPWYYAFAPWAIFLVWHMYKRVTGATYVSVEEKFPSLREELRTAADSGRKDNPVVNALHHDVMHKLRNVMVSEFIGFKKLTKQIFLATLMVFLILFFAANNVKLFDTKELLKELDQLRRLPYYPGAGFEVPPIPENESSIYGNKSLIELGTQELQLQITPLLSDLNVNKVKPPEEQKFREGLPREIVASPEASYEENIPKEHQQIVKNYFSQIVKG